MVTQKLPTHAQSFAVFTHYHGEPFDSSDFAQVLIQEEGDFHSGSLPPIFVVLEVLDGCPILKNLIATFPPSLQYAIKASLLASDPYQRRRLQVLEKLINKGHGTRDVVEQVGLVPPACLFYHASVFGVIEGMCTEPSKYRRELAFLFTQLSISRLPCHLQQKMTSSSSTLPLTVLPAYSFWYLCSGAEYRLEQAMKDQAVLLINGVILLKFYGKLGGVALQTTRLADGMQLIEGCWYAPIDHRDEIRDAFDRGESCLHVEGEWTLLRALDASYDNLLQQAQAFATTLPAQLPPQIAGYPTRRSYRYSKDEEL